MANSIENVSSVSSGDNDSELQNGSHHEDDFSNVEQREEGEKTPTGTKAEQTHIPNHKQTIEQRLSHHWQTINKTNDKPLINH